MLNVVTGGEADEQARFGDFVPQRRTVRQAGEFLDIVRGGVEREAR